MEYRSSLAVLVGLASLSAPGTAWAGTASGSSTITYSLTTGCAVSSTASLQFPNPTIAISGGQVQLSGSTDATGTLSIFCTNGAGYQIYAPLSGNAASGVRRMVASSSGSSYYITYGISGVSAGGTAFPLTQSAASTAGAPYARSGTGAMETLTVYGRVPAQSIVASNGAASASAVSATYSDVISMTINY